MNKRWCVFSGCGVGYIEEEHKHETGSTLYVRYSENQMYELQLWDSKYVDRFETWQEALEEYKKYGAKFRGYDSPEQCVLEAFPTYTEDCKEKT